MPSHAARFAAVSAVLLASHEVADHAVQTNTDAITKGRPGREGRAACGRHVASYVATQAAALALLDRTLNLGLNWRRAAAALAVSAGTHYAIDRCAGHWAETGPGAPLLVRAAHATGKGGWFAADPQAPYRYDQTLHKGCLAAASLIAAL
ncbi:hypothetical protein [Streptomyces sp. G1]|uniref:hypothetical protein n=1 Tax=Streptomyces sp. G1 TaxID=361572 RepID=UPI00202FF830|nr:hypothetical protein [Streptomyces sp. G1]MCM1964876.1 hypothetical protein [Streptomyces sp. G1]